MQPAQRKSTPYDRLICLMIVLFLAFSACLDLVHKLLPSVSSFTPDISIASPDDSNSIDRGVLEEISEISGIDSAYGTMFNIAYPAEINGEGKTVDLYSYGDAMMDSAKKICCKRRLCQKVLWAIPGMCWQFIVNTQVWMWAIKIKIGEEELEVCLCPV